jgi:hypothetical protein
MRLNMRLLIGIFILTILLFITGCTKECPDCNCPECPECICPVYEEKVYPEIEEASCPAPEPCPRCENIIMYVCPDGDTVSEKGDCFTELEVEFDPVKTNEDGELIKSTSVRPACVIYGNGGAVIYDLGTISKNIEYQVKNLPEEDFRTIYTEEGLTRGSNNFAIVPTDSTKTQDAFRLLNNSVYLFRLKFNFASFGKVMYSNEYIIDTRKGSDYSSKKCS